MKTHRVLPLGVKLLKILYKLDSLRRDLLSSGQLSILIAPAVAVLGVRENPKSLMMEVFMSIEESKQARHEGSLTEYPSRIAEVLERKQRLRDAKISEDRILSREETSKYLHVSVSTIDRLIKDKKIPFYKVAGRTLFSLKRLKEWKLMKEKLPQEMQSPFFEEDLRKRTEIKRLSEIYARIRELSLIIDSIYKEQESKPQWDKEQEHIYRTLFKELMTLTSEENEIKAVQIERLKSVLGISGDKQ